MKTDVRWQSYEFLMDFSCLSLLKYDFKNKVKISRQSLNESRRVFRHLRVDIKIVKNGARMRKLRILEVGNEIYDVWWRGVIWTLPGSPRSSPRMLTRGLLTHNITLRMPCVASTPCVHRRYAPRSPITRFQSSHDAPTKWRHVPLTCSVPPRVCSAYYVDPAL